MKVKCYLDPHDLWLGVYWKRILLLTSPRGRTVRPVTTIYFCPFFCFVVRVEITGRARSL